MKIKKLTTSIYRIPTDRPEADGTIQWDSTTMILVDVESDSGQHGLGYSYASAAAATIIHENLEKAVLGRDIDNTGDAWNAMIASVRNIGRPGIASTAISAVDIALWDLKAKIHHAPLYRLLGTYREAVPIYGSGGFTSYTEKELVDQLSGWVAEGIPRVKMKIGKDWGTKASEDIQRVHIARQAIGDRAELFVDANGAYAVKQALYLAGCFTEDDVSYFEEPVAFDFLEQLAFIRQHIPQDVASGEYGYDPYKFRDVLRIGAVDIMQADATRCLGVTGCLQAGNLAFSFGIPFSTHTAPSIHAHVGCAVPQIAHAEYFYDHVRIENMFFDGVPQPIHGTLCPDAARPGLGLELKSKDADKYRVG